MTEDQRLFFGEGGEAEQAGEETHGDMTGHPVRPLKAESQRDPKRGSV